LKIKDIQTQLKAKRNEQKFIKFMIKKSIDNLSEQRQKLMDELQEQTEKQALFSNYTPEKMQRDENLIKQLIDDMLVDQRKYEEQRVKIEREINELEQRKGLKQFEHIDGIDEFIKRRENLYKKLLAIREDFESKYTTIIRRTRESIDYDIDKLEEEIKKKTKTASGATGAQLTMGKEIHQLRQNDVDYNRALKYEEDAANAKVYNLLKNIGDPQSFQVGVYQNLMKQLQLITNKLSNSDAELDKIRKENIQLRDLLARKINADTQKNKAGEVKRDYENLLRKEREDYKTILPLLSWILSLSFF